ncbi:MAG: glycoside hydrolase family 3 N-terminal domain-containing protein, partial [Phormidesmis sp.]
VTDALVMGGITQQYGAAEAAVLAVAAGADILLMPEDAQAAIAAICEAVNTGRLAAADILRAVERIWRAKHKLADLPVTDGMSRHAWQHQSVPPVQIEQIATEETQALATEILRASQQVSHAPAQSLSQAISAPLIPGQNLVLVDDLLQCRFLGRNAPAVTLPTAQGYQLTLMDARSADIDRLQTDITTMVQLFIRGNPFRSSDRLSAIATQIIQALGNNVQAVVIYGSPYVWQQLQPLLPTKTPCVFTYGQMKRAQAIALQSLLNPNQLTPEKTELSSDLLDGVFTD